MIEYQAEEASINFWKNQTKKLKKMATLNKWISAFTGICIFCLPPIILATTSAPLWMGLYCIAFTVVNFKLLFSSIEEIHDCNKKAEEAQDIYNWLSIGIFPPKWEGGLKR